MLAVPTSVVSHVKAFGRAARRKIPRLTVRVDEPAVNFPTDVNTSLDPLRWVIRRLCPDATLARAVAVHDRRHAVRIFHQLRAASRAQSLSLRDGRHVLGPSLLWDACSSSGFSWHVGIRCCKLGSLFWRRASRLRVLASGALTVPTSIMTHVKALGGAARRKLPSRTVGVNVSTVNLPPDIYTRLDPLAPALAIDRALVSWAVAVDILNTDLGRVCVARLWGQQSLDLLEQAISKSSGSKEKRSGGNHRADVV